MRPGVGDGDGEDVGDGLDDGGRVGTAVTLVDGVGVTVDTGPHALAMMSAVRRSLIPLP
jgi:hypothetical protein